MFFYAGLLPSPSFDQKEPATRHLTVMVKLPTDSGEP